ncbi:putative F-box repeat-containing protein pof10 [Venustampulla echinocandica]|uniref:Putative F-box repeat-containing protein pof10 n=1 Tax=Venustampulla echinocandica TaxID=2656787 RepID=A0A370T9L5_9HELO|nr:putative F-box repeat-containing protein pof10 [Venustampulla echinocandica]RDL30345.1 putative F-box repeat-containing protein pof10 [Venustampulla echinocandica]
MQPEPTETSTPLSNNINPLETNDNSQYGFHDHEELQSADLQLRGPLVEDRAGFAASNRTSPGTGSPPSNGPRVQEELARLSLGGRSGENSRPKPSFQRISEYENALSHSPPRRQSEGPGFKVIKKKGRRLDAPQLDQFPNEVLTHILSHLPAASLSIVSQVSKKFYGLVTTHHAWRVAFSRFFPGPDTIDTPDAPIHTNRRGSDQEVREQLRSELRVFTRLTGLASWRSEYILRTRLLRSLARGKPAQIAPGRGASSRSNSAANNANAVVTYSSQLFATVNHIHANFSNGKKSPRFIHGTEELGAACSSDPNIGKVDNWGLSDPQALPQFAELFVGEQPYGYGDGPAGLPNSMDLSQPFGMVYGEGFPGGQTYFRSTEEMRGRFINHPNDIVDHRCGIPTIPGITEAISAVWIAQSTAVPVSTSGLVGIMTGSTLGIVTTYSLGADTPHGRRIPKGQLTAKWVLSPGVPIISLRVDDAYSPTRKASGRIWAVALNALGEVFYLTEHLRSPLVDAKVKEDDTIRHAWNTGRSAFWNLVEPSRRLARDDPYNESETHGSYSPRSSKQRRLSKAQVVAETLEIEKYLAYRPAHFRKICQGWDMRRRLEVDFAGDDGNGAGEGIVVIKCGLEEGQNAELRRFTRWKAEQDSRREYPTPKTPQMPTDAPTMASLFGGGTVITPPRNSSPDRSRTSSVFGDRVVTSSPNKTSPEHSPYTPSTPSRQSISANLLEEWRTSLLSLENHPVDQITTSAIDMSTYALTTLGEDPLQTVNGNSGLPSPFGTPSGSGVGPTQIPGHRARFLAVGTNTGNVVMWNMRGPQSTNPVLVNELQPLRTIYTDSPQISCVAVSALHVVHGGNDGLVQAWDPLASTLQPVRTLNSRFSSRARRRLAQAEASAQGVGINLYAAGTIALDPDPTILRGMVSLGTHLRYWSYSSSAADQYKSKKRRLRLSNERGSNGGPDKFSSSGRGALMGYIATEQEELRKEKLRRAREEARLLGRFGVGLGGLSEEEALKYAEMVSAEAFQHDLERRMSMSTSTSDGGYHADTGETSSVNGEAVWSSSSATVTPEGSVQGQSYTSPKHNADDEFDQDIEEAIRLSLLDGVDEGGRSPRASGCGDYDIPIKYKAKKSRRSASSSPSSSKASKHRVKTMASGSSCKEPVAADDLDYALRLSLAEARSKGQAVEDVEEDEFPTLERREVVGKGKGRAW